jgi:hypothetical protein
LVGHRICGCHHGYRNSGIQKEDEQRKIIRFDKIKSRIPLF